MQQPSELELKNTPIAFQQRGKKKKPQQVSYMTLNHLIASALEILGMENTSSLS